MQTPRDGTTSGRSVETRQTAELFVALARALHQVGQPSHRVEQTLELAAQRLGVEVHVLCLPTGLIIALESDQHPLTFVIRERLNPVDLARLVQVTAVADEFIRGSLAPGLVKPRLEAIMRDRPARRWSATALVAAYVLSAGAFAVL